MSEPAPLGPPPLLRHPVSAAFAVLLLAAALIALAYVRDLLLLGFLAVLVAVVLSFPIDLLSRLVPRGVATLLTLAAVLALGAGALRVALPALRAQLAQMAEQLPSALARLQEWLRWVRLQAPVPASAAEGTDGRRWLAEVLHAAAGKVAPALFGIVSGFSFALLVLALAFFLAHEPDSYRRGVRLLVPRSWERPFDEGWRRIGGTLQAWMRGILVSMTIMGVVTALGLWAVGIRGWLVLGSLTFLGTFVPYAGAVASAVPGLLVALAQSPTHFLLALAVYLGVHVMEGYIVQPLVMRRAVSLSPALLLGWQLLFGGIFGPLGIVVATPVLACTHAAVEYFWVERRLGKVAGRT